MGRHLDPTGVVAGWSGWWRGGEQSGRWDDSEDSKPNPCPKPRWRYNGVTMRGKSSHGVTTPIKNGRRFLTPLVCAGCLHTGWEAAFSRAERSRTPPDLGLPVQAASNPVSRRPAQTSGVRKRLPSSVQGGSTLPPCSVYEVWSDYTVIESPCPKHSHAWTY